MYQSDLIQIHWSSRKNSKINYLILKTLGELFAICLIMRSIFRIKVAISWYNYRFYKALNIMKV